MSALPKSVRQNLGQVHRENLKRRLEHRIQVAQSQGNESLLRQLEQEMRQLLS